MGQGQSSKQQEPAAEQQEAKTDYYTLLNVERTATDDELKKAYRKKALELHPDRNFGDVERATALFAEVQAAYEVLSDPQERAWYDSHRDQILYGDQAGGDAGPQYAHNMRMTTADDVNRIVLKFNPKMDFDDSPTGFYGGLKEVFDQLADEEYATCEWDGLEPVDYPTFGGKDDGADVVKPFYAVWGSFATKKSYAWRDKYKLSEAADRRVRRLMEKENKSMREEGIREFNEAVRSLVAFVKKRDPRHKATVQSEAERQKQLRDAAAAQAARSRAANAKKREGYVVPDWMQPAEQEEEYDEFASESEEEVPDTFDCVVCDKTFKSAKQLEAHERSKKHIKALKQLQKQMKKEDKFMDELDVEVDVDGPLEEQPVPIDENEPEAAGEEDHEEEEGVPMPGDEPSETSQPGLESGVENKNEVKEEEVSESDPGDDDYAPREVVRERLGNKPPTSDLEDTSDDVEDLRNELASATLDDSKPSQKENDSEDIDADEFASASKVGKAKQKRARRAAESAAKKAAGFKCNVCSEQFPSNTKLFNHIREEGHAELKPVSSGKGAKKGKKRR